MGTFGAPLGQVKSTSEDTLNPLQLPVGTMTIDTDTGHMAMTVNDGATGVARVVGPFAAGQVVSVFPAAVPVQLGQLLESDGTPTGVRPATVLGGKIVGVAAETTTVAGPVRTVTQGVCSLLAGAAIAVDDELTTSATGSAILTTPTTLVAIGTRTHALALSAAGGAGTLITAKLLGGGLTP